MTDRAEFIVTLAPGTSADKVAAALDDLGFRSTSVLGELSIIIGMSNLDIAKAIESVPGVIAVEPSHVITIPPDGPQ